MNAELEALLKALQAVFDARNAEDGKALLTVFELELEESAKELAVFKDSLRQALCVRRLKWIKPNTNLPRFHRKHKAAGMPAGKWRTPLRANRRESPFL
jgi:hypothetical protein